MIAPKGIRQHDFNLGYAAGERAAAERLYTFLLPFIDGGLGLTMAEVEAMFAAVRGKGVVA